MDRVGLLIRNEEVCFLPLQGCSALAKVWDWHRAAKVKAPDIVSVERPRQGSFVIEKAIGVERFIAQEVIRAPAIVFPTALGNDVDDRAAIIAILRRIVVAKNLHLSNGVLIDAHAQFI